MEPPEVSTSAASSCTCGETACSGPSPPSPARAVPRPGAASLQSVGGLRPGGWVPTLGRQRTSRSGRMTSFGRDTNPVWMSPVFMWSSSSLHSCAPSETGLGRVAQSAPFGSPQQSRQGFPRPSSGFRAGMRRTWRCALRSAGQPQVPVPDVGGVQALATVCTSSAEMGVLRVGPPAPAGPGRAELIQRGGVLRAEPDQQAKSGASPVRAGSRDFCVRRRRLRGFPASGGGALFTLFSLLGVVTVVWLAFLCARASGRACQFSSVLLCSLGVREPMPSSAARWRPCGAAQLRCAELSPALFAVNRGLAGTASGSSASSPA
jgi:hypothetical protein